MLRILAAAAFCLLAFPGSTPAYTVSTLISPGCHEQITTAALRAVRLAGQTAPVAPLSRDEQALVDDLEFTPAGDMKDLGAATLLISVRDNDLKGRDSADLSRLAGIHGNPDNQDEHCLRSATQDEPTGSAEAVVACRTFIRGRVVEARDGLGADGAPDLAKRAALPIYLTLRGRVDASLPTYYVRIGQAIHAVEDSFSHTYRTADGMKITVALNWIDEANRVRVESRDGPAHVSELDVCNDPDALRTSKRQLATEASTAFLRATLDPSKSRAEKLVAVDALLDTYLSYAPGCTFTNDWCSAPERQYKDATTTFLGCSTGGGGGLLAGLLALSVLTLVSRRGRVRPVPLALLLVGLSAGLPLGGTRAAEPDPAPASATPVTEPAKPAAEESHVPPPPVVVPVPQPGPRDPSEGAWGAYLGASGSVDKPAGALQLGLRRRVSTHWTLGLDGEWNPWVSIYGPRAIKAGVVNASGVVILRFPLAYENFNLRTTLNLGVSYLLFDLYGAPKGSLGLYGAISPLGLEWKLSRVFLLIINPLSISMPAPQLRGVPLTYPQYRISLGLGILAG